MRARSGSDNQHHQRYRGRSCKDRDDEPDKQCKKKITVPLFPIFTPRFCNRAAISYNTIHKHESATRSEPGQQNHRREHQDNEGDQTKDQNGMWSLIDRIAKILKNGNILPIGISKIEIVITASQVGQPRGKPDHKPFLEIERLKQNLLHQVEGLPEWFEELDFHCAAVHVAI